MKRISIKEAFGGEVAFTKFIANDVETSKRLLDSIDTTMEDGFKITPEEHTADSKRVDLVVRDSDNEISLVVESQDATGWLDSVHASKITYYMYDKKCEEGVLLTEDADEHIKGYVRYLNENTPYRIWLLTVLIFEHDGTKLVDFQPLIRPVGLQDKKVRRISSGQTDETMAAIIQQLYDENQNLFTNVTSRYASRNNVGKQNINIGIHAYKSGGFWIDYWHNARYENNENFKTSFNEFAKSLGKEAGFQKYRGYVNDIATKTEAIEVFNKFIEALEKGIIKV
jgi:hypothetical protein